MKEKKGEKKKPTLNEHPRVELTSMVNLSKAAFSVSPCKVCTSSLNLSEYKIKSGFETTTQGT